MLRQEILLENQPSNLRTGPCLQTCWRKNKDAYDAYNVYDIYNDHLTHRSKIAMQ